MPTTIDITVETGMRMNVEALNPEAGWSTTQLEYICAVTQNGHEHLIHPDQKLFTLPLE